PVAVSPPPDPEQKQRNQSSTQDDGQDRDEAGRRKMGDAETAVRPVLGENLLARMEASIWGDPIDDVFPASGGGGGGSSDGMPLKDSDGGVSGGAGSGGSDLGNGTGASMSGGASSPPSADPGFSPSMQEQPSAAVVSAASSNAASAPQSGNPGGTVPLLPTSGASAATASNAQASNPAAPASTGSTAEDSSAQGSSTNAAAIGGDAGQLPPPPAPPTLQPDFGELPLAFEANVGQSANADSQFLARGRGYPIGLSANEATLVLGKTRPAEEARGETEGQDVHDTIRVQFAGANPDAHLEGMQELPGRSNYFRGGADPLALTNLHQYAEVVAHDVWDSVDVHYIGDQGSLRFDFHVKPGADVAAIALDYAGVDSLSVDEQGQLVLHTASGDVVQRDPILYQEDADARQSVSGHYVLRDDGKVGFAVEDYDDTRELVIDPTLSYLTYLGGSGEAWVGYGGLDAQGNVYVAGSFDGDVFVDKLNVAGNVLV